MSHVTLNGFELLVAAPRHAAPCRPQWWFKLMESRRPSTDHTRRACCHPEPEALSRPWILHSLE